MEYHGLQLDAKLILQLRNQMKECLVCAFWKTGKKIGELITKELSEEETCFWIEEHGCLIGTSVDKEIEERHINYYASLYSSYTNIPADKAMLVETIKKTKTRVSATWEFVWWE